MYCQALISDWLQVQRSSSANACCTSSSMTAKLLGPFCLSASIPLVFLVLVSLPFLFPLLLPSWGSSAKACHHQISSRDQKVHAHCSLVLTFVRFAQYELFIAVLKGRCSVVISLQSFQASVRSIASVSVRHNRYTSRDFALSHSTSTICSRQLSSRKLRGPRPIRNKPWQTYSPDI